MMSELAKEKSLTIVKRRYVRKNGSLWWMYLPALALVSVFMIYPFASGIKITFTNWNGFSQSYDWIGFAQYRTFQYSS